MSRAEPWAAARPTNGDPSCPAEFGADGAKHILAAEPGQSGGRQSDLASGKLSTSIGKVGVFTITTLPAARAE